MSRRHYKVDGGDDFPMVGFLLYLRIAWGVRGVVRLHRILSNIVLIWRLRAGKWFDKGSRCGCLLSNPSSLLKFTAQPTDLLPRGGWVYLCASAHPREGWVGRVQETFRP